MTTPKRTPRTKKAEKDIEDIEISMVKGFMDKLDQQDAVEADEIVEDPNRTRINENVGKSDMRDAVTGMSIGFFNDLWNQPKKDLPSMKPQNPSCECEICNPPDEPLKTRHVEIQLHNMSDAIQVDTHSAYEKGSFYCTLDRIKKKVTKYPIANIFRVVEDY